LAPVKHVFLVVTTPKTFPLCAQNLAEFLSFRILFQFHGTAIAPCLAISLQYYYKMISKDDSGYVTQT